jgi:hypothetical protein
LDQVTRLLDNAQLRLIPPRIATYLAFFFLREVKASLAISYVLFDISNGISQGQGFILSHSQDVVGQPLRRLATNARQLGELINHSGYRLG